MPSPVRRFAFVIDNEVAFVLTPPMNAPLATYERIVAGFSSDPKVIEVPLDDENHGLVNMDWFYIDGKFVDRLTYNPNVEPPQPE